MSKCGHFKYYKMSAEIIRLAVMLYVRFPLSLRNVEDLVHDRGVAISVDPCVAMYNASSLKAVRSQSRVVKSEDCWKFRWRGWAAERLSGCRSRSRIRRRVPA